jgi:hypothetical protein
LQRHTPIIGLAPATHLAATSNKHVLGEDTGGVIMPLGAKIFRHKLSRRGIVSVAA